MNLKNFPKRLDSKTSCLRISVPENLDLALEGLIRKVLKEQPKTDDIYSFAANYFETLLEIRDKTGAKFTAAQLCPFHNDEDAHEMIKLAGTFPKPASKGKPATKSGKPKNVEENSQRKKDVRRSKAKESSKDKKPGEKNKQATPDLIKKLPTLIKSESNCIEEDKKSENGEEFLTSDPIKELVDKELMMEASRKQKTDRKEKTESRNTQEEKKIEVKAAAETKLENQEENDKKQPSNDGNEMLKAKIEESRRNEQITIETGKTKEEEQKDGKEECKEITEDLKAVNEENKKEKQEEKKVKVEANTEIIELKEDTKKIHTEARNTKKHSKLEQTVDQPQIKKEDDKLEKQNHSNKPDQTEINKKEEKPDSDSNKPLTETETLKQVTDVQSDKLSQILGEVMRKNEEEVIQDRSDSLEKPKEPSQVINTNPVIETTTAIPKPSETDPKEASEDQQQTKTTKTDTEIIPEVPKSEKDEIPPPRTEPVEKEAINTLNIPKDEKERTNEAQAVNTTSEEAETKQESTKEDSNTTLTESEIKKDTEALKPAEQHAELKNQQSENVGNAEEHKPEQKELPKDTKSLVEEPIQTATGKEDKKPQETEEPDHNTTTETKVDEKTTDSKSEPENPENKTNDKIKEKPITPKSATKKVEAENKIETSNSQLDSNITAELKENLEKEKKLPNKEKTNETGEEKPKTQILQTENIPTNSETQQKTETPRNQTSGLNPPSQEEIPSVVQEPTKEEEICRIVDTQHLPKENKITTDEKTEKIQPETEAPVVPQPPEEKTASEELTDVTNIQNTPKTEETVEKEPKTGNVPEKVTAETEAEENTQKEDETEELCTVVDIQHLPKKEETVDKNPVPANTQEEVKAEKQANENIQHNEVEAEQQPEENTQPHELQPEELCTVVDIQHLPKHEETVEQPDENPVTENKQKEVEAEKPSPNQKSQNERKTDETLNSQPEVPTTAENPLPSSSQLPDNKTTESTPAAEKPEKRETEPDSMTTATPEHKITVEEAENPEVSTTPTEIQIKTIQTHYYDSLQVPETVTKEYRVHSLGTPTINSLLGVDDVLQRGYEAVQGLASTKAQNPATVDENMNSPVEIVESIRASPPTDMATTEPDIPEPWGAKTDTPTSAVNEQEHLKSESDDLLTPTSGYSLNLSELSYQTIHGFFLDSERRYSSYEIEETHYATPKSNTIDSEKNTENRQEVEEVIEKTTIPSKIEAVPMPPREPEEITEENETTGNVEEEKKEEKPEKQQSEGSDSSNERSEESDIPFISVEVKTVIETQVLDDENEEKDPERPDVEVKVEARIDIQDGGRRNSQSNAETETEIAKEKSEENPDVKSNSKFQSRTEEDNRKECSTEATTGKDCSTGESDSVSSAATEINRTGSGKRDLSSIRGLSSTQSLDFGKRNPLVKTRSLSTFRHGVTDFEVWNTIEKELEDAATKIQSKFRGYKTRKKLQRENAVQITTEESSRSTTPAEGDPRVYQYQQSTGEFHDSIVLSEHPR